MAYSVLDSVRNSVIDGSQYYKYQKFSKDEWAKYPFAKIDDMKWFKDAKYGLFLHVGLSAIGKVDIGWSRETHKMPDPGKGHIPDDEYDHWKTKFTFEEFSAKEWIQLALDGGMKYLVIIAKHHDGFHMWDTAYSDHKITNTPFNRDYIKELVDECHKRKLKVGIYYSQRDWYHNDYEPVDPTKAERIDKVPFYKYGEGEHYEISTKHKRYIEYLHNSVIEIMSNYGRIDILWWDALWYGGMFLEEMWESDRLEREIRKLQPHIIINNRASLPGDFDTPEATIGMFQSHRAWETCMPLGQHWSWTDEPIKSLEEVIRQIVNCACGGGNYLLSIGCRPSGRIDDVERTRIRQIGAWLNDFGESVYKTEGGPWLPQSWGGSTYCGNIIYLHILDASKDFILPLSGNRVESSVCLTGENVELIQEDKNLKVSVDHTTLLSADIIIKMTMESSVESLIEMDQVSENIFTKNPAHYGKLLKQMDKIFTGEVIDIDVSSKDITVMGLSFENEEEADIVLSASIDKMTWYHVQSEFHLDGDTTYTVITHYKSGAVIAGINCKYLKVETSNGETIANVSMYGRVECD